MIDPVTKQVVKKRLRNKGRQRTHMLTINGRIALCRRWWHSPTSGSVAPADVLVDQQDRTVTPGVLEMVCRLNNDANNFDKAAENLARTAQVRISGERLRQLVIAEGQAVLAAQRTGTIPTAFQAEDCVVDPSQPDAPTRMYVGVDGVMAPLTTDTEKIKRRQKIKQKRQRRGKKCLPLPPRRKGSDLAFKEFKVIVFYDEHGDHWHEVLSRGRRYTVGALVRREAKRLNFAAADQRIANVDGASWIRHQLEEQPHALPLDGLGLDFYHLAENVHRCRRKVFGEDDADGRAWAETLLHTFKHEGVEAASEKLFEWRRTLRSPRNKKAVDPKKAADRLINYVLERRAMISYPEFQSKGWQIGSGPTESRCKTSTSRLKGRGRRWDSRNAEAVAALTTLQDSDQWNLYWPNPTPTNI